MKETAHLFLDEIQAMPELVLAVKYLFDHYDVRFYLTGSSSYYMKEPVPREPRGGGRRSTSFSLCHSRNSSYSKARRENSMNPSVKRTGKE